jgi:hypothetical protein
MRLFAIQLEKMNGKNERKFLTKCKYHMYGTGTHGTFVRLFRCDVRFVLGFSRCQANFESLHNFSLG